MGKTLTALQTATGFTPIFVLRIGGHDVIYHSDGVDEAEVLAAHIDNPWGGGDVAFTSGVNVTISGNSLTKSGGGDSWNAGAISTRNLISDGYVEFTVNHIRSIVCGLSNGDTDQSDSDIDFGWRINGNNLQVFENGVTKATWVTGHSSGDAYRVQVVGNTITYWQKTVAGGVWTLMYTSAGTPTFPLLVDCSLYEQTAPAASISGVILRPTADRIHGGLRLGGAIKQSIKPWSSKVEVSRLPLYIDGGDEDLAVFHAHRAGNETYLDAAIDPNDTTLTVRDTSDFASQGVLWLGVERIHYSAKTGSTFTATIGATGRGRFEPLGIDSETSSIKGRDHRLPVVTEDVNVPLLVTDEPREWAGRAVTIHCHRMINGQLDDIDEAELIFAGRLLDAPKDGEDGSTALIAEDARAWIRDCVLQRDQWHGVLREGIRFWSNTTMSCSEYWMPTGGGNLQTNAANDLSITAGWYSSSELVSLIQEWLSDEVTATRLTGEWEVRIRSTDGEIRFEIRWDAPTGTNRYFSISAQNRVWRFFGWDEQTGTSEGFDDKESNTTNGDPYLRSPRTPHIIYTSLYTELEWAEGTWWNNSDWLPQRIQDEHIDVAGNWGLIDLGGALAVAELVAATQLGKIVFISNLLGTEDEDQTKAELRWGEEGQIPVRQVIVISGSLKTLLMHFLASTGQAGYNEADWDLFPAHLGAGIPWDCLDEIESDLDNLAEATAANALLVRLEKATNLMRQIGPDMLVRNAHFVMRGGKLRIVTTQTAVTARADHALSEDNKAISADMRAINATPAETTTEHSRNVVTLEHSPDLAGVYRGQPKTIQDHNSIELIGPRSVSIKLPNTFGRNSATGDSLRALVAEMSAWTLPSWSRPLKVLRRSISFDLWLKVAPGDVCSIDDDFARDPVTGRRGLADAAAVILSHSYSFGDKDSAPFGEVSLVLPRWGSYGAYSPAAAVDYSGGASAYVAGTKTLTCETHAFSESSEDADASWFPATSKIRVVERDPDDPTSVLDWTDTVASQSGDDIVLTTGLAGFDGSKRYLVVSDSYSNVINAQRSDAYQADDSDLQVEDLRGPYNYGAYATDTEWSALDLTELVERYANEHYGDGVPCSVSMHRALAVLANNHISFKSARHQPYVHGNGSIAYIVGPSSADWTWKYSKPYHVQPFQHQWGTPVRNLNLAVSMCSSAGGQVEARVTLSMFPPGGTGTALTFVQPYQQLTYTTTSTTLAILTAEEARFVGSQTRGWGYMTLELRASAAHGSVAHFYGMGEDWLGPLEAA